MERSILVLDAGTTSTRAMRFAPDGTCLGSAQIELTQSCPRPGWVEHDPDEIWRSTHAVAAAMVVEAGGPDRIAAIGIANQRETILFWDRQTGTALAPAIVWQDRRTSATCEALREAGHEPAVQARTGLLLDPYFSGTKIAWALDHWPQLRAAGDRLAIGTVDSWLLWKLTGGLHVTDATNAARTLLMDLESATWDDAMLDLFGAPRASLPTIVDSAGRIGDTALFGGRIPITAAVGDQQAAAIGQGCLAVGDTKATYGTGAFVLAHAGDAPPVSQSRLIATVAWQVAGERRYALEGSVFVAGSLIQWLRDALGLIATAAESEALARAVCDNGGVYCVPALAGLGAPHWRADVRGSFGGLSFATRREHLVRAALEAQAHQTHDLMRAFTRDGIAWSALRIDGGMVANDWMAQDLADMLAIPVDRPAFHETTALGAAMLAAVGAGMFATIEDASTMRGAVERFTPAIDDRTRQDRLAGWSDAVARLLADPAPTSAKLR